MIKLYPQFVLLFLLLPVNLCLEASELREEDGNTTAGLPWLLEANTLQEWQLISGNAVFSDADSYLGKPSLILDGSGDGTILKRGFAPDESPIIQTELYLLPEVGADGDISVDLNGVLLSFTGEELNRLSVDYKDGSNWIECGSCEAYSWLHLELIQDYRRNRASLKMNGAFLFEELDFEETLTFEYDLDVKGSARAKLCINAMTVSFERSTESLADSDEDGLSDSWENQIVDWDNNDAITTILDVGPNEDNDGDGLSNADEFSQGTSPTDYYNGQLPVLKKISGDLQRGAPGSYVAEPLVVQVLDASGEPLVNAPVTFEVIEGSAELSVYLSEQASTRKKLTVRTDAEGLAKYGNPLLCDPDAVLFYDDFDEKGLNREKWDISTLQVGRTEYGNLPELMVTEEGIDVARFRLDTYNPARPEELFYGTSIKTYREFEQRQIIEFEARARLVNTSEYPAGRGLVGAFSLYNDVTRDEVDWSYLSNQLDEGKVLTNIYNNGFPMHVGDVEYAEVGGLNIADFNTYTTRWSEDKIEYFVNGRLIRTGPNRGILNDVPEDPLHVYLSFFAPAAGFAKAYSKDLQPAGNPSFNESYFFDVDYVQVRTPQLETIRAAGTAPVYLRQGALGESTVRATAASDRESADVSFSALSEYNEAPGIRLRNTGDLAYGDQYIISWDAEDKEGDARISLYCDTDHSGSDGVLIAESLNVSNTRQYAWNTAGVEEGSYYIYATIDDGVNDPVTAYSDQSIYVPHAAYSENQLSNGSFEFGEGLGYNKIEGWESQGEAWHYSRRAYQGVFHAKLTGDSTYYQDIVTAAGQPWCALVYALNPSEEPLDGVALIKLSFYDDEGNKLAEYNSEAFGSDSPQDQYLPLKIDAVAPEKSVLARITLSLEGAGSVYFDEVSFCKQIELNNSSFELGETVGSVDIDCWQHFGETYLYEGSPRRGGWHTAAFGAFPEDGRENYSGCYQEVPAREGELWHASIYALNPLEDPIQNNNEARLNLVFVDEDGTTLPGGENSSESVFSNSLNDKHLLLDVSAYAPPGTAYARIVPLFIQRENSKGCIFFDDARLYKETGACNAGFELGDGYGSRLIWGWTPFGEGVYHDHTYPLCGDHHLRLVNHKDDTHTGVYQDFAVIAGEAWRAKAYARISPEDPLVGNITAHLGFYYLDKHDEIVGSGELNSNKLDADSLVGRYLPLAIAGIAPEGAVRLRLVPVIAGNGQGTVFFDQVSIEKIYKSHRDRDDDGLPDLWEKEIIDVSEKDVLRLRSDIVADEDLDQDGLNNEQEFMWNTHPLVPDTDADGILDGVEVVAHSDPMDHEFICYSSDSDEPDLADQDAIVFYGADPRADTDGDGISDWVETFQSFTNVLVDEFGKVDNLLLINGSEYIESIGGWQREGTSVYARDRRGSLSYVLNIAKAGSYHLEIEGRQYNEHSDMDSFELSLRINGIPLGQQILRATYDQPGTIGFYLPHLDAGEHNITVQWINGTTETTLEIIALRLQAISGPDLNDNGIADWIDTRLSRMSALDESPVSSPTSPYTLEGKSYTLDQLKIQSNYSASVDSVESMVPRQGLIGNYYAHIDLNPEEETLIQVSDQGGAASFEKKVVWSKTNIMDLDQERKRIRQDDSLLLTAFLPDSTQETTVIVEIITPDKSTETFEIETNAVVAYHFEHTGTYQIKAIIRDAESFMQVEVLDAELGANPIVYMGAQDRSWTPSVPEAVILEHDLHVYLDEVTSGTEARNFILGAGSAQPGAIIARLGENGPIMDSAHVEAVVDYRNSNGSWDVTEVFSDGSRLVEITIQLSEIPEDLIIELASIKAGVTFDDGLIRRTVTADDFNESGVYLYRMIIASGVDGSSCHKVNFYQGDTWVGGNY